MPPPPPQRKARTAPVPAPPRSPAGKSPRGAYPPPAPATGGAGGQNTARGEGGCPLARTRSRSAGTSGGATAPRTAPSYLTSRAPPPPRASRPRQCHVTETSQRAPDSLLPLRQSERSPPPGDAPRLATNQREKMHHRCRPPAGRDGAIGRGAVALLGGVVSPPRSASGARCVCFPATIFLKTSCFKRPA